MVLKVAAIQMTSTCDVISNLDHAEKAIQSAAAQGAQLIVLPEEFALFARHGEMRLAEKEIFGNGRIQDCLSDIAHKNKIWLVGGTIPIATDDPKKVIASCLVWNDQGACVARYNKIHLFDVQVDDKHGQYCESNYTQAGDDVVVVTTPWGRLGLAVCYDLRFPELFRAMQQQGMDMLAVPAAFTAATGRVHWQVLLQARAIENLCYVIASGQCGLHENGRETFGHSMVIAPWGNIIAELDSTPDVLISELDLNTLPELRNRFPALNHRRI